MQMSSIRKNKLWKELYNRAFDNNLLILQDKDWEAMFHEIIIEYLTTGIDPFVLLEHKNNNLPSIEKTKEDIDKAVEIILQEIKENEEVIQKEIAETPTYIKKSKKDKK